MLGQFNLGFILGRLGDDLFIVDQHASDEIFNFERLQASTTLTRQPLLAPRRLELTAGERVTLAEHQETFRRNGFEVREAEDGSWALTAVPLSKTTVFGVPDVMELLAVLEGEAPVAAPPPPGGGADGAGAAGVVRTGGVRDLTFTAASIPRPSRVRAMLAMRACRSSIMIGTALDRAQMRRVLEHLAGLHAPWNCPHGRPTMRHVADLSRVKR